MWSLWARQCMQTYVAPESATTSRIRGSARPPETSLTIVAPAASASAATSARMVSTDTVAPSRGELADHRDHAAELLLDQRPGRAGTGRLTADVEDVGAVGEEVATVRDRGVRWWPSVRRRRRSRASR